MAFDAPAGYDRFMGRYSVLLAPQLADLAGVGAGQRALDVGSGPGALAGELVHRLGDEAVAAVDPSEPFVAAVRERHPGVDARVAPAEELPFPDDSFDVALAQLSVHFMSDPVAGIGEMRRVTRPGGVVAACVWDLGGGRAPLGPFWKVAHEIDPKALGEAHLPGTREGHLGELFRQAGLGEVEESTITVSVEHESFDDWWEPFTLGVGPAGSYLASLDPERQAQVREQARASLPEAPFSIFGVAWAVRGVVL